VLTFGRCGPSAELGSERRLGSRRCRSFQVEIRMGRRPWLSTLDEVVYAIEVRVIAKVEPEWHIYLAPTFMFEGRVRDPIEAQAVLATYGQDRTPERPLWWIAEVQHRPYTSGRWYRWGHQDGDGDAARPAAKTLHVDQPSSHVDWTQARSTF